MSGWQSFLALSADQYYVNHWRVALRPGGLQVLFCQLQHNDDRLQDEGHEDESDADECQEGDCREEDRHEDDSHEQEYGEDHSLADEF